MPNRYKTIIDCYCRGEKYRLHQMISMCSSIHDYVYGIDVSENGKVKYKCCLPACKNDCFAISKHLNWHQHRIAKSILNRFSQTVQTLNYNNKFSKFDDFFEYIAKNSGLSNGRCLLVYDFCLRQGHHLSPHLEPDDYVYLFRGAREGAEHVLGKLNSSVYKLPTKLFQQALNTNMSSMEIEHFLCVCKEHLECVGSISQQTLLSIYSQVLSPIVAHNFSIPLNSSRKVVELALEQHLKKHYLCSDKMLYKTITKLILSKKL